MPWKACKSPTLGQFMPALFETSGAVAWILCCREVSRTWWIIHNMISIDRGVSSRPVSEKRPLPSEASIAQTSLPTLQRWHVIRLKRLDELWLRPRSRYQWSLHYGFNFELSLDEAYWWKGTLIVLFFSCQHCSKRIRLEAAEVEECHIDNKQFAFRIRPDGSKRIHYLQAPSETCQSVWIQAIRSAGHGSEASQACIVQWKKFWRTWNRTGL